MHDHRDEVKDHPIDQPLAKRLTTDIACHHTDVAAIGVLAGTLNGTADAVCDEGERSGSVVIPVGRDVMSDHEDVFASSGSAVPAVGEVEEAAALHPTSEVANDLA